MKTKVPLFRIDRWLIAILALLAVPQVKAQTTNTWVGGSGAWLTTGNWSPAAVPTSTTVARFTNTASTGVGINTSTTSTNNVAGFLISSNGTVTISNSSTAVGANNSNAILRVFGWVEGSQTNLIVNDSTSGNLVFSNHGSATATLGLMRFTLSSGGVINVSNSGARVSLMSLVQDFTGTTNTITKTGAGTLIIGGTNVNTFAGGVVLSAGVLQLNKSSALGAESGLGLTINGGSLDNGSGGAVTLSSYAQTWGGDFTFIGTTNLNLGAGAVNLTGTRTVTVTANALTVGGTITNSGGITKAGAGTLILNGANTYSGTTTVNAGTLSLGNANALQNSLLDTGTSGLQAVTFDVIGNNTYNIGGLQGADALEIGGNTLSVGAGGGSRTYSGAISGTGGALTKVGEGTLTLSANSSYTGATTVGAGLLAYNGTNTSTAVTINSGATLGGSGSVGAVTVNSSGRIAPGSAGVGTLSVSSLTLQGGSGYNWELTSVAGGQGSGWDLINVGSAAGTVTVDATSGSPFTIYVNGTWATSGFSGTSSYDWTIIAAGTLSGFAANKFAVDTTAFTGGTAAGTWGFSDSSGDLVLSYTAPVLSSTYGWVGGSGAWGTAGNWTNNATPTNGSSLLFSGAAGTATNDATVTSVVGVNFSNTSGSIVLAGDAFSVGSDGIKNESGNSHTISNNLSLAATASINAASSAVTIAGNITNDVAAQLLTVTGGSDTTVSGVISGQGNVTKTGAGSLTLGANSTFTGTFAVNQGTALLNGTVATTTVNVGGGTLLLGAADLLANGATLTLSSGTVNLGGFSDTVTTYNQSGGVLNNGMLTAGTYGLSGGTVAGNLGTGTINVTGSTALNGTAAAGTLNINSGTLTLGSASRLTGTTPAVTVAGGATLALGGAESVGSIAGAGAINLGSSTLTAGSANTSTTFGGVISGSGGLSKAGNGTLTLSGANAYTGTTTVSAGELSVSNNTSSSVDIASGATFSMNAAQTLTSLTGSGALKLGSSALTFSNASGSNSAFGGVISGSAGLTKVGAGTLMLAGANTYGGGTLVSAGTLQGDTASLQNTITNNASVVFDQAGTGTYGSTMSGLGSLTKIGAGTLTLSAANTYAGATAINVGALRATIASALGGTATNTVVASGAALELAGGFSLNAEPVTISGSGIGDGGAIRNISGTNTNTGFITLVADSRINSDADLLVISTAGTDANAITGNFNLTLGGAGNFSFLDRIAIGTGVLTKDGSGTLTLISPASHSGGTTLSAGNIQLGASENNALGTGTVTLNGGILSGNNTSARTLTNSITIGGNVGFGNGTSTAALTLSGPVSLGAANRTLTVLNTTTLSGAVSGTGASITKNGAGNLILSNNNTFDGGVVLNAGNLTLRTATAAGTGSIAQTDATSQLRIDVAGTVANNMSLYNVNFLQGAELSGALTLNNGMGFVTTGSVTATNSGILSGANGFAKSGSGTLVLSGNNAFTGSIVIGNGAVSVAADANLGAVPGAATAGAINLNGGKLLATSGFELNANRGIALGASGGTIEVAGGQRVSYGGVAAGAGAFTKSGAGSMTFSGANTYSGATTVSAGTLELANTSGAAIGSTTSINVATNATLLVSQSLQVNSSAAAVSLSGGTIRTAAGIDETFGNLSITGSGFLDFGTTSYANANTISFGSYSYTPSALLSINNFNFGSTLTFSVNLSGADLATFSFTNGGIASSSWDGTTFTITAIPEPSTCLAAAGLLSLMLWPSRKRLLKDAKKILGLRAPMRDRLAARRA